MNVAVIMDSFVVLLVMLELLVPLRVENALASECVAVP